MLDEVDAVRHPTGSCRFPCSCQSGGRDVDGDDGPPVFGEPDRVGSLSAAQIQSAGAGECGCDLGQSGVYPTTPYLRLGRVMLFPGGVGVADGFTHQGLLKYDVSLTSRTDAPLSG